VSILPPSLRIPRRNAQTDGRFHLAGAALEASDVCVWEAQIWRTSVHHLSTRIKTLWIFFLQNFAASSDKGNAWYFQDWNIRAYAQVTHAEDVFKLKLDLTSFQGISLFYANALEA
jgi:hypothetical protein